jgi:hypothetical protein
VSVLWVPVFIACGSKSSKFQPGGDEDASTGTTDDGSGSSSSGGSSSGGGGSSGVFASQDTGVMFTASACKAGHYTGSFTGSYSSHLILGIPLTVMGNVDLTLNQAGGSGMMCKVEGEGFVSCSDVFNVSGGHVFGTANQNMIGEASFGGYPYFCNLTGTLDCATKKLVNGWIQCTYCVGDINDAGDGCVAGLLFPDGGVGGHFSGPVTADYNTGNHTFTNGTWNGAESISDLTMMPSEDSGIDYIDALSLDGGYGFLGKFGGSGMWTAALGK